MSSTAAIQATSTDWSSRRARRAAAKTGARRLNPAVPILLTASLAITANLTGVVDPAVAAPTRPKPRQLDAPPITERAAERGRTVREAFEDARRAASEAARTASTAIRATLNPPTLYTVQDGDTLFTVTERYDLKLAKVLALNGLSWRTTLVAGQILKLTTAGPVRHKAEPKPEVVPHDQRHTIQPGETLSSIAAKYGVHLAWILSANGFSASSIIYSGQTIVIPAGAPKHAPRIETAAEKPTGTKATSGDVVPLTAPMKQNAETIIRIGRDLGVPNYGIVIALATAAQESGLRNLPDGDLDSVGLFQQRPSAGWGTAEQLAHTAYATKLFYGGPENPNKGDTVGLLDIPGWQSMPLTVAAQKVQMSAYPDAYAKWETSARAWLKALG